MNIHRQGIWDLLPQCYTKLERASLLLLCVSLMSVLTPQLVFRLKEFRRKDVQKMLDLSVFIRTRSDMVDLNLVELRRNGFFVGHPDSTNDLHVNEKAPGDLSNGRCLCSGHEAPPPKHEATPSARGGALGTKTLEKK